MKVIIAGSRTFTDAKWMEEWLKHHEFNFDEVVSGKAPGADRLGEAWAKANNIPVKEFPAQWKVNGVFDKAAGFKRNKKMAAYADALVAFWDGNSNGTFNMIQEMMYLNKPVCICLPMGVREDDLSPSCQRLMRTCAQQYTKALNAAMENEGVS